MSRYSQRIVEHFAEPQNVGEMEKPDATAFVGNPVCGDQIHLFARITDDRVTDCSFLAYGCAASLATASILTVAIKGRHLNEIEAIDEAAVAELVGGLSPAQRHCAALGRDVLHTLVHNHRTGTPVDPAGPPRICR